jgi:hypothetical protein
MTARNLPELAEALKSLTKYPDRPIIDYWRTIQGTPVGFHGKVGEGIPIAGPPVLTGGSASGNPLLAPLLKKYPAKTFIGGAIRKPNFPLSAIMFIENFVGKDEKAIKARFADMEQRISVLVMRQQEKVNKQKAKTDALNHFNGKTLTDRLGNEVIIDTWNNPIRYNEVEEKFYAPYSDFRSNKEVRNYLDDLNNRKVEAEVSNSKGTIKDLERLGGWAAMDYVYKDLIYHNDKYRIKAKGSQDSGPASMLEGHFLNPSRHASYLYKIMQLEGVAGTFTDNDYGAKENVDTKESMDKYLKDASKDESYARNTDYEKCKDFLGDLYVLNQIMMKHNKKKTEKVTRGMGKSIAGLSSMKESMQIVAELEKQGVSMRFVNRPVSGFASGEDSTFRGWTVSADIPAEAILSSTFGAKIQGGSFSSEKEALVIGAASLAFAPEQITFVGNDTVYTSKNIADKVDSGDIHLA